MSQSVAIIGGGYAGLACAVELTRAGHQVTVFERSQLMGGRARRVDKDGWSVDNGQHILIGAYTELTRLLRLTGVSPKVLERMPLTLHVPGRLHLRAAALPAPLHLAIGILTARGLDWADRKAMIRLMRYLKQRDYRVEPELTVKKLLQLTQQTERCTTLVWNPLCVAALNTPAADASALVFANVLRDSLGADASASELLLPRVDLSELFPVQAARYLATRRGRIHTACGITGIEALQGSPAAGFRLAGNPSASEIFDQVVIATAPYHAASLLLSAGGCDRLARQIDELPFEPITTVYFALGAGITLPWPMIGLADGPAQWAFDRGRLGGRPGLLAMVISARGPHESLSRDDLEIAVHRQLEKELGQRLPTPEWAMTITEKRATLSCRPGLARPDARTPLTGLWLAGDYLDSPYPSTLESAVRSGVAVAGAIARNAG